jgi:hypothetical protein
MQASGPLIAVICGLAALIALGVALYCMLMESRLAQRWDVDWAERAQLARSLALRLRLAVALLLLSLPTFIFAVMGPL